MGTSLWFTALKPGSALIESMVGPPGRQAGAASIASWEMVQMDGRMRMERRLKIKTDREVTEVPDLSKYRLQQGSFSRVPHVSIDIYYIYRVACMYYFDKSEC